MVYTGCPRKHDSWWLILDVFFHDLLSSLMPKKIIINITLSSYCSEIDKKIKYNWAKVLFNEINCKKFLISYTVYERRHLKLFTNCHVSWDTLYLNLSNYESNYLASYLVIHSTMLNNNYWLCGGGGEKYRFFLWNLYLGIHDSWILTCVNIVTSFLSNILWHKLWFSNPISLQPDVTDLIYFTLWFLSDQTFLVWNIKGLHHQGARKVWA